MFQVFTQSHVNGVPSVYTHRQISRVPNVHTESSKRRSNVYTIKTHVGPDVCAVDLRDFKSV